MQTVKKIVAVLGGSFDPPTVGHLDIAAKCLDPLHKLADEVWVSCFSEKEIFNMKKKVRFFINSE